MQVNKVIPQPFHESQTGTWAGFGDSFFVGLQGFLACKTEEFDLDMDGEKAPICYKEITTALRQWILPTFVSVHDVLQIPEVVDFYSCTH